MDRQSTLELVKHDEADRAPECDWDATAFELDASVLAPQVVYDTTPQVSYNHSPPEVHNIEESTKECAASPDTSKLKFKRSLMIIVLVVAVTIAIGVGVGIWHHRKNAPHGSSINNSSPAPRPTTPQNPKNTNATQYILNDTSLAALILPGGDRQLFFQDNNGSIRRATRPASENQWTISQYLNLSSNPKSHTPLAATVYNRVATTRDGAEGLTKTTIGLQYVSGSHILISDQLDQGDWNTAITFGNWSTAVNTRSLSFCLLPLPTRTENGTNVIVNLALLIYESPTRKVSALVLPGNTNITGRSTNWVNITSQESKTLPDAYRNGLDSNKFASTTLYESDTNATFSTPFTCAANSSNSAAVGLLFYSPGAGLPIVATDYSISPDRIGRFSPDAQLMDGSLDYSSIRRSDIATFGTDYWIWINGTQPVTGVVTDAPIPGMPGTSFPFTRLASVTSQSTTYLYHQMNGTTFAEEQWYDPEGTWSTEYIHVSDP